MSALKLDEEELHTIEVIAETEQCGRLTKYEINELVRVYREAASRFQAPAVAEVEVKPLDDWHEDCGDVLWWCWREGEWLGEAPYCGSPLDLGHTVECITHAQNGEAPAARFTVGGWPGYHTHWSPVPRASALRTGGSE